MKGVVLALLILMWVLICASVIYLVGAWCLLSWDYITVISPDGRGGMVGATALLSILTIFIPLFIYEEIYE